MNKLVSADDILQWRSEAIESLDYYEEFIAKKINQRHEKVMAKQAIRFAEFWAAEHDHPESYYCGAKEAYEEMYQNGNT